MTATMRFTREPGFGSTLKSALLHDPFFFDAQFAQSWLHSLIVSCL
jgi:hypothetical protein